jgi:hypothetical protein
MKGYEYTGATHDTYLACGPAAVGGGALIEARYVASGRPVPVFIRPEDCPAVAASIAGALYGAIGAPPPIILDRPILSGPVLDRSHTYGFRLYRTGTYQVGIEPRFPHGAELQPIVAKTLAANIAAFADVTEQAEVASAEPDPVKVAHLATVLRDARVRDADLSDVPDLEPFEALARAALAAGYRSPGGAA